ncbi:MULTISPECIES: HigA family addiction module antitoxin [unclassified Moraxella]|uniref:HigA family addiction module antitoxin n=1 Tax=unclassified Moraxella TaxID=2685852 RepID=UPI002B40648C|nr:MULTISPECIES: HigA family addiction module antitoxin [unclassified Moraxella]
MKMHNPAHPGLVLKDGLGDISVTEFAKHLGVSRVTLSRILNGKQSITADMSLRIARALGTSDDLWFRMQNQYDLWQAQNNPKIDYTTIVPLVKPVYA